LPHSRRGASQRCERAAAGAGVHAHDRREATHAPAKPAQGRPAGFIDLSHVVLGLAVLPLVVVYAIACLHGGRWRLYFPWAAGAFAPVARDVAGLLRGERPMSEGGGLFSTIEGLLLLALLATAATGALWFAFAGAPEAYGWRAAHLWAARGTAVLLLLHVVAVSLHLVDLLRG